MGNNRIELGTPVDIYDAFAKAVKRVFYTGEDPMCVVRILTDGSYVHNCRFVPNAVNHCSLA